MVVGSDAVGLVDLGGPGFDLMSPARIRRAASHCGDTRGWLTEKTVRCFSQRRVWLVAAFVGEAV